MQSALVGFPINYLSLYLNSLVYADFKDFVGGTMPSCLYCTQFNRTGIQVGLISSNGAIMMKSLPAALCVSSFPWKDPEEFIEKSVIRYIAVVKFISCTQQKKQSQWERTKN